MCLTYEHRNILWLLPENGSLSGRGGGGRQGRERGMGRGTGCGINKRSLYFVKSSKNASKLVGEFQQIISEHRERRKCIFCSLSRRGHIIS